MILMILLLHALAPTPISLHVRSPAWTDICGSDVKTVYFYVSVKHDLERNGDFVNNNYSFYNSVSLSHKNIGPI